MKVILLSIFVFSFSLLGAEPKVVGFDKLQKRGKAGSQLIYIPNQDSPFTGKAVRFYPNAQKSQEATFKDGNKDGLETSWWRNGQKLSEKNYKDGKLDGLWTWWKDDGTEKFRFTYKDDEEVDRWEVGGK